MGLAFHAVLLIYFYLDIGLVSTNVGKMRTPKFSRQTDCCPFLSVVPEHPPRANTTICRRCALRETIDIDKACKSKARWRRPYYLPSDRDASMAYLDDGRQVHPLRAFDHQTPS
jgi:hypothetical protein